MAPAGEVLHVKRELAGNAFDEGEQKSLVCQINAALIRQWFDGELEWTEARLEAALDISDESIRGLLMRLTREIRNPGFASEALLELIATQIAIELGRYCASVGPGPVKGGLAAWQLRTVDDRVREVRKAPTVAELSELCNLSVRQLSRAFQTSRGCSIGHHIEKYRLETVKRLLQSGQPVQSVADVLGFSSPSALTFAFRRMTGITPSKFQQLM